MAGRQETIFPKATIWHIMQWANPQKGKTLRPNMITFLMGSLLLPVMEVGRGRDMS